MNCADGVPRVDARGVRRAARMALNLLDSSGVCASTNSATHETDHPPPFRGRQGRQA